MRLEDDNNDRVSMFILGVLMLFWTFYGAVQVVQNAEASESKVHVISKGIDK